MIVHRLTPAGAFVAGDTETRLTALAAPGTPWMSLAEIQPDSTARDMLETEAAARRFLRVRDQGGAVSREDAGNWAVLDAAAEVVA